MVLAEICERFGQLDETENFATRAAAIAPGNVSASLPRAKVLRRRKRVEEAEAVLLEENRRLAKRTRWKIFYPHNCRLSGIVIFPKRKKFRPAHRWPVIGGQKFVVAGGLRRHRQSFSRDKVYRRPGGSPRGLFELLYAAAHTGRYQYGFHEHAGPNSSAHPPTPMWGNPFLRPLWDAGSITKNT